MTNIIEMPEIATTQQVAAYLQISDKTVYNYTARKEWMPGIYIGRGRYNMCKLREYVTTPPYRYVIDVRSEDYCRDLQA